MKNEVSSFAMDTRLAGTVSFKSNLYEVKSDSIVNDKVFLSHVHDPFGLTVMKNRGIRFTKVQDVQYFNASGHCAYAFEDDYPWGTVIDQNGNAHQVCRCLNTECTHFKRCRPDFDVSELEVKAQNVSFVEKIEEVRTAAEVPSEVPEETTSEETAKIAAAVLYEEPKQMLEKTVAAEPSIEKLLFEQTALEETEQPVKNPSTDRKADSQGIPAATFESFSIKEQEVIIQLSPDERTIVNAGPGTGKTWTLIEKLKYMLNNQDVSPENILVLCFSRAAVEVIRDRLKAAAERDELPMNWHVVDIRTFDSFATYLLAWAKENIPEQLPEKYALECHSYDDRISEATNLLQKQEDLLAGYQHIIVDEVQDLVGVRAQLVMALLNALPEECGFTLLGDSCQGIYDYLSDADKTIMSSTEFYHTLFDEFRQANYFSLEKNYRQDGAFGEFAVPYRNAILTGSSQDQSRVTENLLQKIRTADIDLKHFSISDAEKYTRNGTLGILTRTNGQALQISSWLRTEEIPHQLQKPNSTTDLAGWIYDVLSNAATDVLDYGEFAEIFERLYPSQADSASYWDALISTQADSSKNHYEISDLLQGLIQNIRSPLLFENPVKQHPKITVSNIHRAKGREFDTVLMLSDLLKGVTDETQDNRLEHKVCYVALTRPKKNIEQVELSPQYINVEKGLSRRCSKVKPGIGNRKGYITHIEVGLQDDLNQRSFAENAVTQELLSRELKPGTRLKFFICPESAGGEIVYRIATEDNEQLTLGFTGFGFMTGIESVLQRVWKTSKAIDIKWFPRIWTDIYVDDFTTCLSTSKTGISGAKRFGDMYVWKGISVSGFARIEKDTY